MRHMLKSTPRKFRNAVSAPMVFTYCTEIIHARKNIRKIGRRLVGTILLSCLAGCSSGIGDKGVPAPELSKIPTQEQQLLIIGASSGVGLETTKLALQRGHRVTAVSRSAEAMPLSHDGLTKQSADILDAQHISDLIAGHDAIVISIGRGPTRKVTTLFSEGTANVLAGMHEHGVKRLIAVTGIGAGDSRGHGGFFYDRILQPLALRTIYEDKDRQEGLIRASNVQWTIVRPGFFIEGPIGPSYRVTENIEGITAGDISRGDVAHFILACLESGLYINGTPLISQ